MSRHKNIEDDKDNESVRGSLREEEKVLTLATLILLKKIKLGMTPNDPSINLGQ